ncbi:hypothetical protein HDU76_009046, partial [Blyttiomyces sp. JEL0837]
MIEVKASLSSSPTTYRKFSVPLNKEERDALMVISEGGADHHAHGYEALTMAVNRLFFKNESQTQIAWLPMYMDDEGDWIAMSSQEEFEEAAKNAAPGKPLKVSIRRVKSEASPAAVVDSTVLEKGKQVVKDDAENIPEPAAAKVVETNEVAKVPVTPPEYVPTSGEQSHQSVPPEEAVQDDTLPPKYNPNPNQPPATDTKTQSVAAHLGINDFHYRRLIIQTAITAGIRSLFESPNATGPSNLDYAMNEILYGRTLLFSAIEEALKSTRQSFQSQRGNFDEPEASTSGSNQSGPEPNSNEDSAYAREWRRRHAAAIEALQNAVRKAASTAQNVADAAMTSGIADSIRAFARDIQSSVNTLRRQASNLGSKVVGSSGSSSSASGSNSGNGASSGGSGNGHGINVPKEVGKAFKVACTVVGMVVVGVGHALNEIGNHMMKEDSAPGSVVVEDPFSGVPVDLTGRDDVDG